MSPEEMKTAAAQVEKLFKEDAVKIMGIEGEKHFKKSFVDEGFTDEKLEKWQKLKPATIAKKRGNNQKVLTEEGHLADAVDWEADYNGQAVTFKNDRPYAQVHNEGGKITRRARTELFKRNRDERKKFAKGTTPGQGFTFKETSYNMPKRQFMGPSKVLEKKIVDKITKVLDKIFKQ